MNGTVRIKVIPPLGCDRSMLDERGWMEAEAGTDVRTVLKRIRCGRLKAKLLLVSVNGERVPLSTKLKDGDVVGFFMPMSGG